MGDAFDNALMECVIGLCKTECVRTTVFHSGPYRTIGDVEFATAGWVDWYNNRRLHSTLGMMSPPWSSSKPTTRLSTESRNPYRSGGEPGALQAVHRAVRRFNEFPHDAQPPHVDRMRLIMHTPTLQLHSVLRYGESRHVIADYLAGRLCVGATDPLPSLVGHVSLALAQAAYDQWLQDPSASLPQLVSEQMVMLRQFLKT